MNVCGACNLDFGSVVAFDRHRVGRHAYTYSQGAKMDPPREDGRRCLSEAEMEALLDTGGNGVFEKNPRGRWTLTKHLGRSPEPSSTPSDAQEDDP